MTDIFNRKKVIAEIEDIQRDFDYIKKEIGSVAEGLSKDFANIGSQTCANNLWNVQSKVEFAETKFNLINGVYSDILKGIDNMDKES